MRVHDTVFFIFLKDRVVDEEEEVVLELEKMSLDGCSNSFFLVEKNGKVHGLSGSNLFKRKSKGENS